MGDVATTVKDTGNAIGKRDVRGVGKGVARGEIFPRLPFCFFFSSFLFNSPSLSIEIYDLLILCSPQARERLYREWAKELARQYPVSDMAQMPQFLG